MGDRALYEPLTMTDRVTVLLYRAGIALSTLFVSAIAYGLITGEGEGMKALLLSLYVSIGLSVFFIHLYVGKYKRNLVKLYMLSVISLLALIAATGGDPGLAFRGRSYGALFLLPLSGCLGFITAKEAFCFKLMEGYLLALLMPAYLLLIGMGAPASFQGWGLAFIAGLLILFTSRKAFMPLHCDIGDKSAYC